MANVKTPQNPSKKATARVKNPLPAPTSCRFCKSNVRIATHLEVYGRDYSDWPYMYLCDDCGAYVGMHPFTNIPLGTLADRQTRLARKMCKMPLENIWKSEAMTRSEAYTWLAGELNISVSECHFGWFDVSLCEKAKDICLNKMSEAVTNNG